jgi:hypothetical protein
MMLTMQWTPAVLVGFSLAGHAAHAFEVKRMELKTLSERDAYQVDVEATLEASPAAVRQALLDTCRYRDKGSYLTECYLFHVDGKTAWSYVLVRPPILDPRDYIIRRTVVQDLASDGSGTLQMVFTQDPSRGPPLRDGAIRVTVNEGSWLLKAEKSGAQSMLQYTLTLSPGGIIPLWIARMVASRATPGQLERIERKAVELERGGQVTLPDANTPWSRVLLAPLPTATVAPVH